MKQKSEIIIDLEENEILPRLKAIETLQSEVDALQTTVSKLRILNGETQTQQTNSPTISELNNFPGYPTSGSLLEKYSFLEDKNLKLWLKDDFDNLIEKIEGPIDGSTTLKDGRKKIYYYIQIGKLIRVIFGGKRKNTFFTTRLEWFELSEIDGKKQYRLIGNHLPESALLVDLTEEQKMSPQISLNEIN